MAIQQRQSRAELRQSRAPSWILFDVSLAQAESERRWKVEATNVL